MSADSRVVATVPAREAPSMQVAAPLTVQDMVGRRQVIKQVIEEVMVEGVHYGMIPGTNQMSLLKDGAELLLSVFHIAVEPIVTDLSTVTEVRFRVECRGTVNGAYVGSGIGICSSNEEKYRWRKPKSQAEFDEADPSHKKIKYGRDYKENVVRQSPYDAIQTVLSMAEKRAKVDLCKGVLAASECLKDKKPKKWGNGNAAREERRPPPPKQEPKPEHVSPGKAQSPDLARGSTTAPSQGTAAKEPPPPVLIDEEQIETISNFLDRAGIPDSAFLSAFEIGVIPELEASRFEAAMAWLQRNSP
jgi:hypothetical protein